MKRRLALVTGVALMEFALYWYLHGLGFPNPGWTLVVINCAVIGALLLMHAI